MLRTRVLSALVALPLIIALVFAGGWWYFFGAMLFALAAGWEFHRMMRLGGYGPTLFLILGLIALLLINSFWSGRFLVEIISLVLLVSLVWQLFQAGSTAPTVDWALTLAGGFYVGWGFAHLVALRQLDNGLGWVWLALLTTWGADTLAYLVGSRWGRHKVWPRLSPKKSWEGLLGSLAGGVLGAAAAAWLFGLNWPVVVWLGLIVPLAAFFGDLSESMMKRHVGVKDASNLFPGHGGVLDRVDSVLFVSIVVYYYAYWVG